MDKQRNSGLTAGGLHILAMALMLCDHMWAALFPAAEWLTCLGRLAFPIFAFLLAEGFFHTHNLRRYLLRLLLGAVLSEIPFNLMYSGSVFYPFHQNVLWTFLLSLLLMALMDRVRQRFRPLPAVLVCCALAAAGFLLSYGAMLDYYGVGVLTPLVFYAFRGRNWRCFLGQLACLYLLHVRLLGGYFYEISIAGFQVQLVQQGLALLALIPIWLYQGRQGPHSRAFQIVCYGFYPAHMLVLYAIRGLLLS